MYINKLKTLHFLNESAISIDDCSNRSTEWLTLSNYIIFIYFRHCTIYGKFQKFLSILMLMLIIFPLEYAPDVIVQQIHVWRARRPYVWCDVIEEHVTYLSTNAGDTSLFYYLTHRSWIRVYLLSNISAS